MSYSDDVNIAAEKAAQELCDHRFISNTGYGYSCRYCHLQVMPFTGTSTGNSGNDVSLMSQKIVQNCDTNKIRVVPELIYQDRLGCGAVDIKDITTVDLDNFHHWYKSLPVYRTEGGYIHCSNLGTIISEFIIQQIEASK